MEKSIVENNEVHLLGGVHFVVHIEFLVHKFANVFDVGASLINEWSLFSKLSVLIEDVLTLEVSKEEVSHEEVIIEALGLTELFFGDLVEDVKEDLLVVVVDKLVNKGTLALVAPETDVEELRLDLFLKSGAFLDDLVLVLLANLADTTEDTGELTNVELVMELGGGGEETLSDGFPEHDSGLNDDVLHVNDVLVVVLGLEDGFQNATIDVLDGASGRRSHVEREELTLQSVGDVVTTTSGMVHSGNELELVDLLESTTIVLGQEVETLLVNELTGNFKGNLISPSVNEGHAEIIQEDGHVLATEGHEDTGLLTLDFRLNGLLEIEGSSSRGVEATGVHDKHGGLGGTSTTNEKGVAETPLLAELVLLVGKIGDLLADVLSTS
jgi:hypothetical protein